MEDLDEKDDIRNVPKNILKELIATYKAHPALWQIKNKDLYSNRMLKHKGHQALVNVWKKYDKHANIRMVKNKIQSLRGSFRKELKKVQNSSGTEYIYKSHLWYFSLMSFLTNNEQPKGSTYNLDAQELRQDSETHQYNDNWTADASEEMSLSAAEVNTDEYAPAKKKKKEEKRILLVSCKGAGNNQTENDAFGKFVSKKLDKISNFEQRMYAESLIIKVVNYALLNKLSEFSDIMGEYSNKRETNTSMSNYSSSPVTPVHEPDPLPGTSVCEYVTSYETIESEEKD